MHRSMQCRAATSDFSAEQMVPQGDLDIPFISGLFNTIEWLGDYNKFYEKRCLSKPHVASN